MAKIVIRYSIIFAILLSCSTSHAETYTITVKGPELMPDAIEKLETIYDLPITYDELIVPYENQERPTVKFPDGLSFTYEPMPVDTSPEDRKQLAAKKISEVLNRYSSAYGKDMYAVHEGNGGFHVVQIRYVNKAGEVIEGTPILDASISVKMEGMSPQEAVNEIFEQASKATGQQLSFLPCGPAACGSGHWYPGSVTISASNEPARDVLDRVLAQLPIYAEKEVCPNHGCFKDVPGHLSWRVRWSGMLSPHLISPPGMVGGVNALNKPFLNAQDHTLRVEGDQPIVKAIDQLEQIYGIPISYEDPPHVPGTENVVDKAGRKLKLDSITITYGLPPEKDNTIETRRALAGKALMELMTYVQRHSTQYIIVNMGTNSFEVEPQFVLGDGGKIIQERTFDETRLSIPQKERTNYQFLEEICRSVSGEDRALHIGTLSEDFPKNQSTNLGAREEPAIAVLGKLLPAWRILCNPNDNKDCSINFHSINSK